MSTLQKAGDRKRIGIHCIRETQVKLVNLADANGVLISTEDMWWKVGQWGLSNGGLKFWPSGQLLKLGTRGLVPCADCKSDEAVYTQEVAIPWSSRTLDISGSVARCTFLSVDLQVLHSSSVTLPWVIMVTLCSGESHCGCESCRKFHSLVTRTLYW